MMSANWVSVKIMVSSECRPTGFLPTARPPIKAYQKMQDKLKAWKDKHEPTISNLYY